MVWLSFVLLGFFLWFFVGFRNDRGFKRHCTACICFPFRRIAHALYFLCAKIQTTEFLMKKFWNNWNPIAGTAVARAMMRVFLCFRCLWAVSPSRSLVSLSVCLSNWFGAVDSPNRHRPCARSTTHRKRLLPTLRWRGNGACEFFFSLRSFCSRRTIQFRCLARHRLTSVAGSGWRWCVWWSVWKYFFWPSSWCGRSLAWCGSPKCFAKRTAPTVLAVRAVAGVHHCLKETFFFAAVWALVLQLVFLIMCLCTTVCICCLGSAAYRRR